MFTEATRGAAIHLPEPLPCPFCGGEPQVYLQAEATRDMPTAYVAGCTSCGAEAAAGESQIEACMAWNKRHKAEVRQCLTMSCSGRLRSC
jgi:Lar family restriction alleviation protein